MNNTNHKFYWRIVGKSVRGDRHVRQGLPNQDAMLWFPESGEGSPLMVAIADGHGSGKCFRSDEGSELAVSTAIKVMRNLLEVLPKTTNLSLIKQWVEEKLPLQIVHCWRAAVADNLFVNRLRISELEKVKESKSPDTLRQIVLNPLLAYGSTLLAVLVTESFIIYLQLGDGEILTVSATGEVCRPLPRDERFFGGETASLCIKDAHQDFRVGLQLLLDKPPAMILLTTDGYPDSFVDDASFLRVGPDILEIARSEGLEEVDKHLTSWLKEANEKGSGDDATVGIIYRVNEVEEREIVLPPLHVKKEAKEAASEVLTGQPDPPLKLIA